jgi:hypothetical protein
VHSHHLFTSRPYNSDPFTPCLIQVAFLVVSANVLILLLIILLYSTADWKFGAEQFDKLLSDKVIVHRKLSHCVHHFVLTVSHEL